MPRFTAHRRHSSVLVQSKTLTYLFGTQSRICQRGRLHPCGCYSKPLRMRGVWAREAVGVAPVALATRHAPFQVAPRACRAARVGRRTRLAVVVVGVSRPAPRQVQVRLPIRCRAWSPLCGLPAWQQSAAACPWIEPAFSRIDIGGRPAAALPSQRPSVSPGVGYPLTHLESRCSGLP
jgi:hypothetical protein